MLKIDKVSKSYGKSSLKAVDAVSFEVARGEIYGFLGPNEAGKTTMIKMIVGLLRPDEGTIFADGIDVWKSPIEGKRILSYVPDNPQIYTKLKGIVYLNFIADVYGVGDKERKERIEKYASMFEMDRVLDEIIESYSHGMQQKIVLIGALLHESKVLILDEPMVGLDPKASFTLKELMRTYCENGSSVFFSTHILDVAQRICDRVAIIDKGRLVTQGTIAQLQEKMGEDESLEEMFLEITKR
ncbi:MAG: ABC transporter ATP-binding protein [Eubacteriaceae bacterium]|nr:ABC transporter ATP-binding protein [Eubacteriaceae bacterium]